MDKKCKSCKFFSLGDVVTLNAARAYSVFKSAPILIEGGSEGCSVYNQSDLADIHRNNKRLRGNLDCEAGSKIWKAMEALGVVYKGGEKGIVERIEDMEIVVVLSKEKGRSIKRVHHVYRLFKC